MARGKRSGKKKQIKGASAPDKKRIAIPPGAPVSPDRAMPSWRFRGIDTAGPWAWPPLVAGSGEIDRAKVCDIRSKLGNFETMTWAEIKGPRHHAIAKGALCPEAQKRLVEIERDDAEEVFSFALQGLERVITIRNGSVAELLWWDPNHKVCPSKKKHT